MRSPIAARGWCPGTRTPMETGDGLIVRLHPPRASLTPHQLHRIADLATRHGNGVVDMTSRGNLQIRGVTPATHPALLAALDDDGLVDEADGPGPKRLVLTSPLAGHDPQERFDGAALGDVVERAARTVPGLPAKMSIVIDPGGQVAPGVDGADIVLSPGEDGTVLFALANGRKIGPVRLEAAPETIAGILRDFANARAGALHAAMTRLADWAPVGGGRVTGDAPRVAPGSYRLRGGLVAVIAALPFGQVAADRLAAAAEAAIEAGATVIRGAAPRALAFLGVPAEALAHLTDRLVAVDFIVDAADRRLRAVACTGAPACSTALQPTREIAAQIAARLAPRETLHVSGCAKGCAHRGRADLTLVGERGGFRLIRNGSVIDAGRAPLVEVDDLVVALAQPPVVGGAAA